MSEPNQNQILNSCPECQQVIDVTGVRPYEKIICPHCQQAIRVRNAFNHFTILGEIGEGGMSRVFQAQDNTLGREVALKILHTHFEDNSQLQAQFEREAKVTASINHPNVVKVYSVGADQGYFFIAMELLETASLDHQISAQGKIDEISAMRTAHEVSLGLAAAFERGLIHRDIKPGNILVDSGGTAKLVDFGLALVQGEEEQVAELWATPFYVPPEKLVGKPEDFRSDVYSLGATLYHMLAGSPPYDANTNSIQELIALKAQPVNLKAGAPHLQSETIALVHRMMSNRPEMRPNSYADLIAEVSKIRQKIDPNFEAASEGQRTVPLWLKVGGGLVILGFVIGLCALLFTGQNRGERVEISNTATVGSGGGEVIVSAAESRLRRQFIAARNALAENNLEESQVLFTELAESDTVSGDVKAWSEFHLGVLELLNGSETASIAHFAKLAPLAENGGAADQQILKAAAENLSQDQRVSRVAAKEAEESGRALLCLPYGLKNWSLDDYEGARRFLQVYTKAEFPASQAWMGKYKTVAASYLKDATLIAALPALEEGMDRQALNQAVAEIEKAKEGLNNDRGIALLDEKAAQFQARIKELASLEMEEAFQRDLELLRSNREKVVSFTADLDFKGGAEAWQGLEVTSNRAKKISHSIAEGWELADQFFELFSSGIGNYRYEGEIRRRNKGPFTARVVQADRETLVVDLGFGPTILKLEAIEPGSVLEIAKNTVIPDLEGEKRQCAAFFAWLIGEDTYAQQLAEDLYEIPGFPRRWEAMTLQIDGQ